MASKRKTVKKYIFTLKFSCTPSEVISKYDLSYKDTGKTTNIDIPEVETVCYTDESKKIHKCMISKIDFSCPSIYRCFWCRNPFTTQPIGCPTNYIPSSISRQYFSEITKDKFTVKESTVQNQKISSEIKYEKETNNHYETDGIFCGFSCCMSYIKENKKNPLYSDSEQLLYRIYSEFIKKDKIIPAPHWRMLTEYGGTLSIEEFRSSGVKTDYEYRGMYKPTGSLFEEKIKF